LLLRDGIVTIVAAALLLLLLGWVLLLLLLTVTWLLLLLSILLRPPVITGLFLAGRLPEVFALLLSVWLSAPLVTLFLLWLLSVTVLSLAGESIILGWFITAKNVELLSTTRVLLNFN